ncbi:hypothetical protein DRO30_04335 [Candidatus Bathyarchaeota archaeon]|nr:MAG: hypothetical protein DRO30_04335 [Candidatus Bathyarchaeota archaeon]
MIVFTDWEGPWALTDFAYECTLAFLNNPAFFERLSQYDDYLAFMERKKEYEVGDTLKLLAPFLIAAKVTSNELEMLANKTASFIKDCKDAAKIMSLKYKPVVVSSAYEHFVKTTTRIINFKAEIYATRFKPEKYRISEKERKFLLRAVDVIANLPEVKLNKLDSNARKTIKWLNNFFWNYLKKTELGKILEDVKAVGGRRKKQIIKKNVESMNIEVPVFIGDSISDSIALEWVKKHGFAISFNGNSYAIKNSNIVVISDSALAHPIIINTIEKGGLLEIKRLSNKDFYHLPTFLKEKIKNALFEVYITSEVDLDFLIKRSENVRKKLRGFAGKLS